MGHVAHFKGGQHLFLCHVCGFTFHSEKKKIMWDGTITCGRKGCYEPRHPQEFKRGIKDDPSVENASPEPADVFISTAITADDL